MTVAPIAIPSWLSALILLAAAHVAPWAAARVLGSRWAAPLDAGATLRDGRRLFGDHKTWRGVLASGLLCALLSPALGHPAWLGGAFAALAMSADLASSFLKRRLKLVPGREVPGLDQLPEALVPLLVLAPALQIRPLTAALLSALFLLLDLAAIPLRHHRKITPRSR